MFFSMFYHDIILMMKLIFDRSNFIIYIIYHPKVEWVNFYNISLFHTISITSHFSTFKNGSSRGFILQAAASHHQELGLAGRSCPPRRLSGAGRTAPWQSGGADMGKSYREMGDFTVENGDLWRFHIFHYWKLGLGGSLGENGDLVIIQWGFNGDVMRP